MPVLHVGFYQPLYSCTDKSMVLYLDNANSAVVCAYLDDVIWANMIAQDDRVLNRSELCWACSDCTVCVCILSVQQCALCIVSHMSYMSCSSCCITTSALYSVAAPKQADQDDRVMNYAWK